MHRPGDRTVYSEPGHQEAAAGRSCSLGIRQRILQRLGQMADHIATLREDVRIQAAALEPQAVFQSVLQWLQLRPIVKMRFAERKDAVTPGKKALRTGWRLQLERH